MGHATGLRIFFFGALILGTEGLADPRSQGHTAPISRPTPSTYSVQLPSYDSERVQKVTRELLETFRGSRPDNWGDLERAVGAIPWNTKQTSALPAFDAAKVGSAVENIASDISRERPESWDELKGILKNYTGSIPPAVMEDIIAYRILQRKANDNNQDSLDKVPSPTGPGNSAPPALSSSSFSPKAAVESVVTKKIGLFSQFFAGGSSTPASPSVSVAAPPTQVPGAQAPAASDTRAPNFPAEKYAASSSSSTSEPKKFASTEVTLKPDQASPASVPLQKSESGKVLAPAVSIGSPPPVEAKGKIGLATINSPSLTGAAAEKNEIAIPTSGSVLPSAFTGQLLKNAAEASYVVTEPATELDNLQDADSQTTAGSASDSVSGINTSYSSTDEDENTGATDALIAFVRQWLLAALDAQPDEITRRPASAAEAHPGPTLAGMGIETNGAFDGFSGWNRTRRHQAVVTAGAAIGLGAASSLLLYHCALAAAWIATLGFLGWMAFHIRRSRHPREAWTDSEI